MSRQFHWAGYLLGFALGGFFDGVLLHQILQWHHLLSALEGEAFRDIRVQILADGLFHAAMYFVAVVGLWLLWRARLEFVIIGADRILFAHTLIGFGVWHVVDAVFSHWLTGIHRIRMDSQYPLVWDIGWLVAFGLVPLVIGLMLRRSSGNPGTGPGRGSVAGSLLAAIVLGSGVWSTVPPPNVTQVMVYFGPGAQPAEVMAAAAAVDARVIWSDSAGELWAFDLPQPGRAAALYAHGALFVSNSLFPAGCLSWSRAI